MDYYEEIKRGKCECGGYFIPLAQYSESERVKDGIGEYCKEVPIPFRLCSQCLKLEKIRLGENPGMWTVAEGAKLDKVFFLCRTYNGKPQYYPQGFLIEGEILIEPQKIPDSEELESIRSILDDGRTFKVRKEWLSVLELLNFLGNGSIVQEAKGNIEMAAKK